MPVAKRTFINVDDTETQARPIIPQNRPTPSTTPRRPPTTSMTPEASTRSGIQPPPMTDEQILAYNSDEDDTIDYSISSTSALPHHKMSEKEFEHLLANRDEDRRRSKVFLRSVVENHHSGAPGMSPLLDHLPPPHISQHHELVILIFLRHSSKTTAYNGSVHPVAHYHIWVR